MNEQKFLTNLQKWLRGNNFPTCVIEAKIVKGSKIPYSALKEHQARNLKNAQEATITYKIPDDGFGQKPFDAVVFTKTRAYVAVMFYDKRGVKDFYLVPIRNWRYAEKTDITRSFSRERADRLGIHGTLGIK